MGDLKTKNLPSDADVGGETQLRGGSLSKDDRHSAPDRTARQQSQNTDSVVRTDGEEDTLYEDGLELENDERPLTGINGKDDSR